MLELRCEVFRDCRVRCRNDDDWSARRDPAVTRLTEDLIEVSPQFNTLGRHRVLVCRSRRSARLPALKQPECSHRVSVVLSDRRAVQADARFNVARPEPCTALLTQQRVPCGRGCSCDVL
jgi:hypothetical protein